MIYFVQRANGDIKIGFTEHYQGRVSNIAAFHGKLELLGLQDGDFLTEAELHARFAKFRLGKAEWFSPDRELMNYISMNTHLSIPKPENRPNIKLATPVQKAVNILVGEMQSTTGESVSVSEALWKFIQQHRPDIAKKAEKLGNGESKLGNGGK